MAPAMELEASAELYHQGRRPPWRRTVAVQAALCLALYAAFSLGEPQLRPWGGGDALASGGRGGGGVSFLSVAGGARPPADQARLLRQVRASVFLVQSLAFDLFSPHRPPIWDRSGLSMLCLTPS